MTSDLPSCPLCASDGGTVLWRSPHCRVIRVDDADYPGFCRVIWNAHVREMSDLSVTDRHYLLDVVNAVEQVVRTHLRPDKINLASFGNMVPHVHWHVIPRWQDDRHYPEAVWAPAQRASNVQRPDVSDETLAIALQSALATIN